MTDDDATSEAAPMRRVLGLSRVVLALGVGVMLGLPASASAANFAVTRLDDPVPGACAVGDCSLREAVIAANATLAADSITLGTGTYDLTQVAATAESPAVGDLDITAPLTITGVGAASTTIDANQIDRVLDTNLPSTAPGLVQITGVTVTGGDQSGIRNAGGTALSLTDSAVVANTGSQGGGIDSNSGQSLTLVRTTVSGNTAANGGGIYVAIPATLTNVTISGNTATSEGGGFYNEFGTSTLTNTTIASNVAPAANGGGIANFDVTQLKNTIVANNTGDNCDTFDRPTSLGHNLESGTECGLTGTGDLQSTNPLLGGLANNGGPTQTRALLFGSPAIDAGDSVGCPPTDQRGVARPQGAACDIGAYEFDPPQTTITAGPSGPTADSTPDFTFTSSKASSTFQCRVDTGAFAGCASPHTTAALGDGLHTFEVRATDALGQLDQTPASRTFTVDATPPDTTITAGPSGPTADSTPEFTFSAGEAGSTFQCRVDAAAFAGCASPHTTAALGDGLHTFEVRAIDALGNVDQTPASRTFTVDATPPDTTITAGPSGPTADGTPSFEFSAGEANSTFECRVDAAAFASCTSPHTTAALGDGQHTFEVRAIDALGQGDPSPATRTFTVDSTPPAPPDTQIVSGPTGVTRDRTPTFAFSSNVGGTTFECSLDDAAFSPCSSPFVTNRALRAGSHVFRVRARDAAGNLDPTPASFTFAIPAQLSDLPAPVLGKLVNAEPAGGFVSVAEPAGSAAAGGARSSQKGLKFVPLREAKQIAVGSFFNTRKGRVRLQTATTGRKRQLGVFGGGLFQTLQSRQRRAKGLFDLRLKGSSFASCRTAGHGKKAAAARHSKRSVRRLRGDARGRFRTRGRYSAATVRGTIWTVTDRCDGTLTKVARGKVAVRDFRRRKNVLIRAGKSYLARIRR